MKRCCVAILIGFLIVPFMVSELTAADKKAKQIKNIHKMRDKTLKALYKVQPGAQSEIAKAEGYGVFDLFSLKIFVGGSTSGKGIVVDNSTKRETFMKMMRIGAGLGMGIKDFRWVFVFETREALNDFINSGWEFGASASAAVKDEKSGGALEGAMSVAPGIWVYQLTKKGLSLEAMVGGTKYWKDGNLN
jgi:lipid-binding SYLF domain-containing protein